MLSRHRLFFIWRYLSGRIPWDSGIVPPEITGWIEDYTAQGRAPGRALDIGCGTGTTSIYLAEQGWDVTGVDFAPNAIRRARRKVRHLTGPGSVTFFSADVSRPNFLDDASPFDLVVDVGCLHSHSFSPDRRTIYAAHLKRLTVPGATYLLYAFRPTVNSAGKGTGLDHDLLASMLSPAFDLVDMKIGTEVTNQRPSGWYTLRRTQAGG